MGTGDSGLGELIKALAAGSTPAGLGPQDGLAKSRAGYKVKRYEVVRERRVGRWRNRERERRHGEMDIRQKTEGEWDMEDRSVREGWRRSWR